VTQEEAMTRKERSSTAALLAAVIMLAVEVRGAADPRMLRGDTQVSCVRKIIVSLADCRLALVEGDRVVKIYHTAVGAPKSPSPIGTYQIANRIPNPTYYTPGKVIPPGPANPLGTRWLGLSLQGYGIHGTNQPKSIGKAASHGCIRMRNRDIEELFSLVRAGDEVAILSDATEELSRIFSENAGRVPTAPASALVLAQAERN